MEILFLVFLRMSSFLVTAPIFGGKNVPKKTKAGLALFLSIIVFLTLPFDIQLKGTSILDYSYIIIKEIFVGWILGFAVYLVFSACYLAGQLIDFQIGYTMVSVFDPLSQIQVPITGNLYYFIFLTIMLSLNAHHYLIRALVYSYEVLPLGQAVIHVQLYHDFIKFFTDFFILAFKIASPVILTIFIVNIALGILVKTAPQMNMFVVGIPLKLILGLLTLLMVSPIISSISDYIINQLYEMIFIIIKGLIP